MSAARHFAAARSVVALGLAGASIAYGLRRVYHFTIDDAGIVYAYAEHLAHGLGFRATVSGPVVEGYSDFLWVALLAVGAKLGIAPLSLGKPLGVLFLGVTCAGAGVFVRALSKPACGVGLFAVLPTLLLALCPEFVVWAPSGLENALFSALLVGALVCDVRETEGPERFPLSAVCGVGLALTRPEGIAYLAVIGLAKISDAIRSAAHRRQFRRFVAWSAVPLATYHALHYAVFRSFVPNTFFAKAPIAGASRLGARYLGKGLVATAIPFLAPLAAAALARGLRKTAPAFGMMAVSFAFAVTAGGDWMPHYRFVGLAAAPLVSLTAVGAAVIAEHVSLRRTSVFRELVALAVALAVAGPWFLHHRPRFSTIERLQWDHLGSRMRDVRVHQALLTRLGLREATFLTHDFGAPALLSSASFAPIEITGLCDASVARIWSAYQGDAAHRDAARAKYFFHESDEYPTLLYFPAHFLPSLEDSPELRYGYTWLNLPREAHLMTPTYLHRGALVDFFPDVEHFLFAPLDRRFSLVGSRRLPMAKQETAVDVWVLSRTTSSDPVTFLLRQGTREGVAVSPFPGVPSLGLSIRSDEPLHVRLRAPAAELDAPLALGIRDAAGKTTWFDLPSMVARQGDPPLPFPNDLPGTSDPALLGMGRELRRFLADRHDRADRTLSAVDLGRRLERFGRDAETRGVRSDAYLALVWAGQADSSLVPGLVMEILALRPRDRRPGYAMERELLGRFYATSDPEWELALIRLYAGDELWDKARFFADRLPESAPSGTPDLAWKTAALRARSAVDRRDRTILSAPDAPLASRAIPEFESSFDSPGLRGWKATGGAFHVESDPGHASGMSGFSGSGFLMSEEGRRGRRSKESSLESASFLVDGGTLTFLLSGASDPRTRVELWVDGKAVLTARGPSSNCFFPTLWDVRPYRGKRATLRLVDGSTRAGFSVDEIRQVGTLAAAGAAK